MTKQTLVMALMLVGCDMPSNSNCLPGRDVSDWSVVEHDRSAITTPIRSCGRTVGYEIQLPDGERANVLWQLERQFISIAGEKVRFGVDIDAAPQADVLRVSMDEVGPSPGVRTEFAFAEAKPARVGRVDINDTVASQNAVMRVIRIVTPISGAWSGRVTGFDW